MFGENQGFDFGGLNLGGVKASMATAVLPKGEYVCVTKDAKIEDTSAKDGSKRLVVRFVDEGNAGVITDSFNVYLKGKAEATRIGLEQLKGMLVAGGHPDPDNIGAAGIASINGLRVGVRVGIEKYQGEDRSRVNGYMPPDRVKVAGEKAAPKASAGSIGMDSDIPF